MDFKITEETQIHFGYEPSIKQAQALSCVLDEPVEGLIDIPVGGYDEITVNCGRGWGKDLFLFTAAYELARRKAGRKILICFAYWDQVLNFLEQTARGRHEQKDEFLVPQLWTWKENKKSFYLPNGSSIKCIPVVEKPETVRSNRAHFIFVNEASTIPWEIVDTHIIPALRKGGRVVYCGTPKGKNWFHDAYVRGLKDPSNKYYIKNLTNPTSISFHGTFLDNPNVANDPEKIKEKTPFKIWLQEYMAEFLDDSSVFTNLQHAIFDVENYSLGQEEWIGEEPIKFDKDKNIPEARYVLGADWAKTTDYTVLTVMNIQTGKVVYWRRIQNVDYTTQATIAMELARKYNNAYFIYDGTGVGIAVGDTLSNLRLEPKYSNITLCPIVFTNEVKQDLIQSLILRVERPGDFQCFIPGIPELTRELTNLEQGTTKLGSITYQAPKGQHDDAVISLALANYAWQELRILPQINTVSIF